MSEKPDDIPQDVWDAANAALGWPRDAREQPDIRNVARAILAERERCAIVEPAPALELPGGTYGLAAIEAYWKGIAATKAGLRAAIRGPA